VPVLVTADGTVITGSDTIAAWAEQHTSPHQPTASLSHPGR
jgi:glutathione S-transferase